MRPILIRLTDDQHAKLTAEADRRDTSAAEIVRRLVDRLVVPEPK